MINNLINYLKNKKILILGFGMEGISTYKLIRKYLPEQAIFIADRDEKVYQKHEILQSDKNVIITSGEGYLNDLKKYDIIMKTPGISFANIDVSEFKDKIKSQIELLLEYLDVFTIGITGTKGKSTTSSLIYEILKDQNKNVLLLGNIGVPVFDYIDKIEKDTILVLEMSSHQLEFVNVSPNIAIILNIYEEHLDHYKSMGHYINAKLNIYKHQKESDYFIYNVDNENLRKSVEKEEIKSKVYKISYNNNLKGNEKNVISLKDKKIILSDNDELYNSEQERKLMGNHNLNNIMFALAVSNILKLDKNKTTETINNFEPLPHRMEFVGKYNDILYYNDSIATIPESAISTIETLKNVNTLIIGGMNRGIDFSKFIEYLNKSKVKNLICLPATGHLIADKIENNNMKKYKVENMEEAVKIAKKCTEKNTICLLSPASASYGFFKNFKERGETFKRLIKNL